MNSNSIISQEKNKLSKIKKFTLKGKVVNNTLDKTITVLITHNFRHSIYKKKISRDKKYLVHDPENKCDIGDYVLIESSRKISKRKYFTLAKILNFNDLTKKSSTNAANLETK